MVSFVGGRLLARSEVRPLLRSVLTRSIARTDGAAGRLPSWRSNSLHLHTRPRPFPSSGSPVSPPELRQLTSGARNPERRNVRLKWFWIPASAGIVCLALLQLERTFRRERRRNRQEEGWEESRGTWQQFLFRSLPTRLLSRWWGGLMECQLLPWLRQPLLGTYVWVFGCNMAEAKVEDLGEYRSFSELFTRELKDGVRQVSADCELVSPADGRVLHFGEVDLESGYVEQVKGVRYPVQKFLGPSSLVGGKRDSEAVDGKNGERVLYHIIVYLAPGDCHHFHSPVPWTVASRRHFHGELLTVAPWAARKMPSLFTLNERVVLSGSWQYGFFSLTAVGAYNVGSIKLDLDEELLTNQKGRYKMGQFTEKLLKREVEKGGRLGCFGMGSSIVIIFDAPKQFQFTVKPGQKVLIGQPIGRLTDYQH